MEGAHRELSAGLADRLGGDDADRHARLDELAARQEATVAVLRDPAVQCVRERRLHLHALDAGLDDRARQLRGDLLVGADDHLTRLRVRDRLRRPAPVDALLQRCEQPRLGAFGDPDPRDRLALLETGALLDHDVLCDVDHAARQVAGVGRAQRRVGETLAGAVRGGEVLQHREPLTEGGADRQLDDAAGGVAHQSAHAAHLADLGDVSLRAGVRHHRQRARRLHGLVLGRLDLARRLGPEADRLLVELVAGDEPLLVLLLHLVHLGVGGRHDLLLAWRNGDVRDRDRQAGLGRVAESDVFHVVHEADGLLDPQVAVDGGDEFAQRLLVHQLVLEPQRLREDLVEEHPPDRGLDERAVVAVADRLVQAGVTEPVDQLHLVVAAVGLQRLVLVPQVVLVQVGHVVAAEHHVERRRDNRLPVRGREQVHGAEHHLPRLRDGLVRQRDVHRHLVAVEVRVVGEADQRVKLDRRPLHEHRLEGLDAQAVQRGCAVEQHRAVLDHLFQDVPDLWLRALHDALGALDVVRQPAAHQRVHDEGLEQLQRHLLRQPALVQPQFRPHDDHGAAGVVDALAQQVLAEPPLLPLQQVGQRLQLVVAGAGDGPAAAAVVDQRVHGLLQHPLLVADDDLRRAQVEQPLQAVVAVDDAAVEVVEVAGGEAAALQLHHGAQVRRQHRQILDDHPLRPVAGLAQVLHHAHPLRRLLALLAAVRLHVDLQLLAQHVQVEAVEDRLHRLRAHAGLEDEPEALFELRVLRLREYGQGVRRDRVLQLFQPLDQVLVLLLHLFAHRGHLLAQRLQLREGGIALLLRRGLRHELEVGLLAGRGILRGADRRLHGLAQRLDRVGADHAAAHRHQLLAEDELASQLLVLAALEVLLQLARLGHQGVDLGRQLLVDGLQLNDLARLDLGLLLIQRLLAHHDLPAGLALAARDVSIDLLVQRLQRVLARVVVHLRDDVLREVDDALQGARRDVQQQPQAARDALGEPDVRDRRGQLDVAHALAANLRPRDLDAALVADDALVADALVLAAVALEVLLRPEDLLAEQPVFLGLERAVVDRLGLRDLAVRPRPDLRRRGQ